MYTNAKIIADSIYNGHRVTSFEVTFPRIILPEFHTHKMIAVNFSSSRAATIDSTVKFTENQMYIPEKWGLNQSGMSSQNYVEDDWDISELCRLWKEAFFYVEQFVRAFEIKKIHKQWANRLIEPWQYVKGICTATDYDNFFWLRDDPENAQPEIVKLAQLMKAEYNKSKPDELLPNEWHLPYFIYDRSKNKYFCILSNEYYDLEDAKKISISLCAQVSYRKFDCTLDKALKLYDRLFGGDKKHASPAAHQATPIYNGFNQQGVTHMYKNGKFASGNLVGWVQQRQLIKDSDFCNHNPNKF